MPRSSIVSVEEPLKEVDLGTESEPKIIKILASLSTQEEEKILKILREYIDVFAWSYEEMTGLEPTLVEHRLVLNPRA